MTTKEQYYQRLSSAKKPTDPDTLAVLTYFGDDNRYWYINSLDCRSFPLWRRLHTSLLGL